MKNPIPLFVAITATALGAPLSPAQEDARPPVPPVPPVPPLGSVPPGPAGPRPSEHHDGSPQGRPGPGPDWRRSEAGRDFFGHGDHEGGNRWRDGGRGERRDEGAQKPTPYLGLSTAVIPEALGAQLSLPEGFGLVVEQVVPDSPAAQAGVQRHDVIKLLNDQQLTDPGQLAALVRAAGKDASVTLTVLRKGTEQKIAVKVGERLMSERPSRPADFFGLRVEPLRQIPEAAREAVRRGEEKARDAQEMVRRFQQRMGDFQKRLQEWQKNPQGRPPEMPQLEAPKAPEPPRAPVAPEPPRAPEPPKPDDLLKESRPGGAPQVRVDLDGNVTTWNTAQAQIVIKDDTGEVAIRTENGKRHATARNPEGKVVFDGPIDTEEQRAALPIEVRRKIDQNPVGISISAGGAAAAAGAASSGGGSVQIQSARPQRPAPAIQ